MGENEEGKGGLTEHVEAIFLDSAEIVRKQQDV